MNPSASPAPERRRAHAKTLTPLQLEVLQVLAVPGTCLRWYAIGHPNPELAGRAQVIGPGACQHGLEYRGGMLGGHVPRNFLGHKALTGCTADDCRPFSAGGDYRDFRLTEHALQLIRTHGRIYAPITRIPK